MTFKCALQIIEFVITIAISLKMALFSREMPLVYTNFITNSLICEAHLKVIRVVKRTYKLLRFSIVAITEQPHQI